MSTFMLLVCDVMIRTRSLMASGAEVRLQYFALLSPLVVQMTFWLQGDINRSINR
jgi:hypothetical protein